MSEQIFELLVLTFESRIYGNVGIQSRQVTVNGNKCPYTGNMHTTFSI